MKLISKFPIVICLLISFSCEMETSYVSKKLPVFKEYLMVHGTISIEDGVNVYIQPSIPLGSDLTDTLSGIIVNLYCNDSLLSNLYTYDYHFFHLPATLSLSIEGSYYVEILGYQNLIIKSIPQYLPLKPSFDSIIFKKYVLANRHEISYSFFDVSEETDYYYIKVLQYADSIMLSEDLPWFDWSNIIFDNIQQQKRISGRFQFINIDTSVNKIEVRLYHLSESIVQFLSSISENSRTEDDAYMEEVVPVYSNIENGYGIWGAYAYSKYEFSVK